MECEELWTVGEFPSMIYTRRWKLTGRGGGKEQPSITSKSVYKSGCLTFERERERNKLLHDIIVKGR